MGTAMTFIFYVFLIVTFVYYFRRRLEGYFHVQTVSSSKYLFTVYCGSEGGTSTNKQIMKIASSTNKYIMKTTLGIMTHPLTK